jgi:5-methylcytosine-specific restriction protein A
MEAIGMAPLKACPRCRKLIPHGLPYCTACAPIAEAERMAKQERKAEYLRKKYNKKYNSQRDPKYSRFYGSKEWKQLSRGKLSACGYKCEAKLEGCQHIACEVHHVIPIKTPEGWEKRYDWDGLRGVCIVCHNILDGKNFKKKQDPSVLDMREIIKNL